jgi:hypothetical protein
MNNIVSGVNFDIHDHLAPFGRVAGDRHSIRIPKSGTLVSRQALDRGLPWHHSNSAKD